MEPSPQLSRIRKALQRYKCWICVTSYLENADLAALTDAFEITCANLETNGNCPVIITLAHRNKLDDLRSVEYTGTTALVYYSDQVGWGVESTTAIPEDTLLFPYYGEFISSKEAKLRHLESKNAQRMNFVLTIREHIPASADSNEGVLVSNIDAALKGNVARFVNHCCDPNTSIVMIREKGEVLGIPVLCTVRAIGGGEQITFHYGGGNVQGAAVDRRGARETGNGDCRDCPTVLGKRRVAAITVVQSETERAGGLEVDKRCYCGAPCCTGFLPYFAFDNSHS